MKLPALIATVMSIGVVITTAATVPATQAAITTVEDSWGYINTHQNTSRVEVDDRGYPYRWDIDGNHVQLTGEASEFWSKKLGAAALARRNSGLAVPDHHVAMAKRAEADPDACCGGPDGQNSAATFRAFSMCGASRNPAISAVRDTVLFKFLINYRG